MRFCALAGLLLLGWPAPARSQSASDSAAVLLDAARGLQSQGHPAASRELLQYLRARYAATAAARTADSLLHSMASSEVAGAGRTGFVTFNTLYGGFLGLAIPAAFNVDDASAGGVGLLLGAPAGFFFSRAFARARFSSGGQGGIASFVTAWGTWMGLAVQQILDIGETQNCFGTFCSTSHSDTAPWAALSLGGIAGIAAGWGIAGSRQIPAGTAALVSHSAFWGSWFGFSLGEVANRHGDGLFTSTVLLGNVALLSAIPAGRSWQPSSSRVHLITAAGLAGGLAGLGIDLISKPDNDRVGFAIPAATSGLGLLFGTLATRHQRDLDSPDAEANQANALLGWKHGLRLGIPVPEPAVFLLTDREGKPRIGRGARLRLFDARF